MSFSLPFHPILYIRPLRPFRTIPMQFDYMHNVSLCSSLGQPGPEPPDTGNSLFLVRKKLSLLLREANSILQIKPPQPPLEGGFPCTLRAQVSSSANLSPSKTSITPYLYNLCRLQAPQSTQSDFPFIVPEAQAATTRLFSPV